MLRLVEFARSSAFVLLLGLGFTQKVVATAELFDGRQFTDDDSLLVVNSENDTLFAWQPESKRVPASVIKLVTAWLSIDKWGLEHQFATDFYIYGNTLWVKGLGDPMMISEELDSFISELRAKLPNSITSLGVDSSLFADIPIPGKGQTNDPYNAPLSALAINFNTVSVARVAGALVSGEPQTPLTPLAKSLVAKSRVKLGSKASRINLSSAHNARQQYAEVMIDKLSLDPIKTIKHGTIPDAAKLVYRHYNSNNLAKVLRGTLEYSNNFVSNQLFMLFGDGVKERNLTLKDAQDAANLRLKELTGWKGQTMVEGAGLSRANQLSARQILTVLGGMEPYKDLLKTYELKSDVGQQVRAHAKSGTLDGVHTFAGYLSVDDQDYKFVFLFNRPQPYRFRELLLQELANDL